jgi:AcrR family transcriptional regulator
MDHHGRTTVKDSSPQSRDKEARERIIDSARRLFASRGYSRTPTKDIAVDAGVATGTVFYHFPTKQDLLRTVVSERSFTPQLKLLVGKHEGDVRGALKELSLQWIGQLETRAEVLSILVHARTEAPDVFKQAQEILLSGVDTLAGYLVRQVGVEYDAAWAGAHGMLASILVGTLLIPSEQMPKDFVATVVDSMLDGLLPRSTSGDAVDHAEAVIS